MKKTLLFGILSAALVLFIVFNHFGEKSNILAIGSKAPNVDVEMIDISGKYLKLSQIKKENGLLVIFSCNTCPFVIAWENRYPKIAALCKKNNIGMVAVNSNAAKRDGDDSFEEMKKHAKEKNYTFNYVVDKNSELAIAFGANRTPQVFLFNKDVKLVYTGAIDDNLKDAEKVEKPYLMNAIDNLILNKKIKPSTTKALGCSIKKVKVEK